MESRQAETARKTIIRHLKLIGDKLMQVTEDIKKK